MTQLTARREKTRDRLLDAARSVFAERGVAGASVEEICERAGFTRGAFYSNFDSKNDLVLAFLHRAGEEVLRGARETLDRMSPRFAAAGNVDALLVESVELFLGTQNSDLESVQANLELRLHAAREPEVRQAYLELVESSHRAIAGVIDSALDQLGWQWTMDPEIAMRLLHGVYEQNALDAIITGREPDAVVAPLISIMLMAMLQEAPARG